jgi:hypothetical protein
MNRKCSAEKYVSGMSTGPVGGIAEGGDEEGFSVDEESTSIAVPIMS